MYKKGLVSIFAMPQEIDDLHITLHCLKRNIALLPRDVKMDIDITFCLSDELTDWEKSKLPQEYFVDKFQTLLPLMDWSENPRGRVELGSEILGCVSQRRWSLDRVDEYDFTLWLDTDMFFEDRTLVWLYAGYEAALEANTPNCIITPQFVRQWDETWDMLVNEQYRSKPLMYHESCDIYDDTLKDHGEISLSSLPSFKFAGGWCTFLSNSLLKLTGIPLSFGHYGLEDTFVVEACKLLSSAGHSSNPKQYMVVNHLVGEQYKHRCNNHMKKYVHSRNRKEEFRAVAHENFNKELFQFRERMRI